MNHRINLSLALVLILCLGLFTSAAAAGVAAEASSEPAALTASDTEQIVTVTISLSETIPVTSFSAYVCIPEGWSTTAGNVKANIGNAAGTGTAGKIGAGYSNGRLAKAMVKEYGVAENELAQLTGFTITYTVPAKATAGEQTVGLKGLKVIDENAETVVNLDVTATVTVSAASSGLSAPAYSVGSLTVRSAEGESLSAIPAKDFLVTVPVTKTAGEGDCLVFLAAYGASGQFRGLMYVALEDVPEGATVKVTLPVKNADGGIGSLKAFCVASFGNLTPLGEAVSFPAP